MSNDDPSDPFKANNRTVIRPKPKAAGGRSASPPPLARPGQPAPRPQAPANPAQRPQAGPASQPSYPAPNQAGPGGGYHQSDDWIASSNIDHEVGVAPVRSQPDVVVPHENIILRAGGQLLALFGRLRLESGQTKLGNLRDEVARDIEAFELQILKDGIAKEKATIAKYAMCATADDIVQNLPTEDRYLWTRHNMLSQFFGERVAGVRFFDYLTEAKSDPAANLDLLEFMHACLALGFEGIHRTSAGGDAKLQLIRRDIHETIRRLKARPSEQISPRWEGLALPSRLRRLPVPVWAVGAVSACLMLGLYFLLRFLLSSSAAALATDMVNLHPGGEVSVERDFTPVVAEPPPIPTSTQLERIRSALLGEDVVVDATANEIFIRVGNLLLFEKGLANLRPQFRPIAEKIALAIEPESDWIRVVGHTDNDPISTARFPSNYELSLERAQVVANVLMETIENDSLVEVVGKGETEPLAENNSRENKALNRRVEVYLPRRFD